MFMAVCVCGKSGRTCGRQHFSVTDEWERQDCWDAFTATALQSAAVRATKNTHKHMGSGGPGGTEKRKLPVLDVL